MKVPFLDLKAQYHSIKNEVLPEIHNVLDNTAYVLGKPVFNFEGNFAKEHNSKHCDGCVTRMLQLKRNFCGHLLDV